MNLPVPNSIMTAALLLGAALALGGTSSMAGPGPMQVEEPDAQAAQPPIQPDQDREGWKSRKNATLTASQQAALKSRQQTMKDMMALIQQKRLAIRDARPEDRQALAQELHHLILEQAQGAERTQGRTASRPDAKSEEDGDLGANARIQGAAWEQVERGLEQKAERLRQQELHRQQIEEKLRQADKPASAGKKDGG